MATRHGNGDGTVYRRADGRYEVRFYANTTTGKRRRMSRYAASVTEAKRILAAEITKGNRGIPTADRTWLLSEYLDYWLNEVARIRLSPTTYQLYQASIRLYLRPGLGRQRLDRLRTPALQSFFNDLLAAGKPPRAVQVAKMVLSAAMTRALREDLITYQPVRLVQLPGRHPKVNEPWSAKEVTRFLRCAQGDPLYPAFVLLAHYGLRRGEVLGLRWQDLDWARAELHVRQQIQNIGSTLVARGLKTTNSERDLPLLPAARRALAPLRLAAAGSEPQMLVFRTASGKPIDPHNLYRSFMRIIEDNGLRRIRLHDLRHSTATLLAEQGVPPKAVQLILGHASVTTTLGIYTHTTMETKRAALRQLEQLYGTADNRLRCRQTLSSSSLNVVRSTLSTSEESRGNRPKDTLLKSPLEATWDVHSTPVGVLIEAYHTRLQLGRAVVNVVVKSDGEEVSNNVWRAQRGSNPRQVA